MSYARIQNQDYPDNLDSLSVKHVSDTLGG